MCHQNMGWPTRASMIKLVLVQSIVKSKQSCVFGTERPQRLRVFREMPAKSSEQTTAHDDSSRTQQCQTKQPCVSVRPHCSVLTRDSLSTLLPPLPSPLLLPLSAPAVSFRLVVAVWKTFHKISWTGSFCDRPMACVAHTWWTNGNTIRYHMTVFTYAQKLTGTSLVYRT